MSKNELSIYKVRADKGVSRVNEITMDKIYEHIQENWNTIREEIKNR